MGGGVNLVDGTYAMSSPGWHVEGRWGWYVEDALRCEVPIPGRGRQRLWDLPSELMAWCPPERPLMARDQTDGGKR